MAALPPLVRAMRPHQWTKNALVVAAPVAAGVIDDPGVAADTALAVGAFCLASSATYLLNDARDVEADRRHPTKRSRPMAAGELRVATGVAVAVVALAVAAALSAFVTWHLTVALIGYVSLTTAYSLALKHVPVVDIVAVAAGFVLRAVAGAAATGVPISQWFFVVTSAGALLMVTGKREAELAEALAAGGDPGATRRVLASYSPQFLVVLRGAATSMALIAYCLWAFESANIEGAVSLAFQLSIVPFTVAILRYVLLIDAGDGAEPDRLVLRDRTLLLAGAAWAIIYGYGISLA